MLSNSTKNVYFHFFWFEKKLQKKHSKSAELPPLYFLLSDIFSEFPLKEFLVKLLKLRKFPNFSDFIVWETL